MTVTEGPPALSLRAYFIVFVASACGLVIEIVAARLLAPVIGVSLYSWSSIIGVVLAGISIGNLVGGRLADRFPSPTTLGVILLAGGLSCLTVVPLEGILSTALQPLPVLTRIVTLSGLLFFPPSFILGMVTPVVIKLRLRDLAHAGNTVGTIYAVSTAGSIFGVFLTGFVLIQWIGTRMTLGLVAGVLVLLALGFGSLFRARRAGPLLLLVFAGLSIYSVASGTLRSPYYAESNYFAIRIGSSMSQEGKEVKVLYLDNLLHSYVSPTDPTVLVYEYEKIFADIAAAVVARNPEPRFLFIGGGGYTLPRYLEATYPRARIEVVEIDPEVTRVAHQVLGLRPDTRIVTRNEDARMVLPTLPAGAYDMVVGDAFNDISVPYHLTTEECDDAVRRLLKPGGIYAVNVVDKFHTGQFLRSFVHTLQQGFAQVSVLRDNADWPSDNQYTFVVAASVSPRDPASLIAVDAAHHRSRPSVLGPEEMENWLRAGDPILLTDDHVPVENMLARVSRQHVDMGDAVENYNAGVILEEEGKLREAVAKYDRAIRLDPTLAGAYSNRGTSRVALEEYREALVDMNNAIRLNPFEARFYFNRGNVYWHLGQFDKEVEDLTEAIRLDPYLARAYSNRGAAYIRLQKLDEALEDFDAAVRVDPRFAEAYLNRGLIHLARGQEAASEADFGQAVALGIDPGVVRERAAMVRRPPAGAPGAAGGDSRPSPSGTGAP